MFAIGDLVIINNPGREFHDYIGEITDYRHGYYTVNLTNPSYGISRFICTEQNIRYVTDSDTSCSTSEDDNWKKTCYDHEWEVKHLFTSQYEKCKYCGEER